MNNIVNNYAMFIQNLNLKEYGMQKSKKIFKVIILIMMIEEDKYNI